MLRHQFSIFNYQLPIFKVPIYEYKCAFCGNQLEVMQKISDAPLTECPKCAGKLEKQWSLSGFQFKGSGWYVSDYTNRGKETNAEGKTGEVVNNSESKTADVNATSSETTNNSDTAKTSASAESTAGAAAASKPEAKPAKAE